MPGLNPLLEDDESPDELVKLWLPSELSQPDRAAWCLPGIPELEFRFRYAQADDSLAEIRCIRRLLQGNQDQNAKHPSKVQRVTRSLGIFDGFHTRVNRAVKRYRHARLAMLALDPNQQIRPGWLQRFQVLGDADVRGPGRESYDKSEGRFRMSWIWLVPQSINAIPNDGPPNKSTPTNTTILGTNGHPTDPNSTAAVDAEIADSMRVHWAKCQARAERYEEEVTLTVEEMGRTLRYFEWKEALWRSLRSEREASDAFPPTDLQQGLRAYACRQVYVYQTLVISFVNQWRGFLVLHHLGSDWLHRYPLPTQPSRDNPQPRAEPMPIPATNLPTQGDLSSSPSDHLSRSGADVDPPMEDDAESDADGDHVNEGEGHDFYD